MDLLLPSLAALVAILILPGWSFYFDVTPKIVVVLSGAAVAVIACRRWTSPVPRLLKWFLRIMAIQAIAIVLATFVSTHVWFSVYGSTWRRSGFFAELAILILTVTGAVALRDVRLWLRITVLASIPVSIYAILQYFGIDPILPAGGYHFGEGKYMIVRPPATLGHAAYLATYLLYVIFAGLELAGAETQRVLKALAAAASALAFFAMVFSGTRAALVGFAAGIAFAALRGRLNVRILYSAAGLAAVLAIFYVSPFGERLRARVFWSSEDPLGGARFRLWADTLKMAAARPIAGYGPETFSIEFPRHESLELSRAFPDFYHESPHNLFLDALVSKGVAGLIGILALAGFGIFIARGFIGAAFVAMLFSQQFTTFTLPTELYFYLPLAILVADPKARTIAAPAWPIRATLALPFALFAIYLAEGDRLLAAARRALDRHEPDSAAVLVNRARRWNSAADFYFSRRFAVEPAHDPVEKLRVWRYGFDAATRAPQTADDPQNALINLAAFQAGLNDAAGVEQTLRQAIAAAPNWYKAHWLLAQVLAQQGRKPEALMEAQAAADRAGNKHPEVSSTLDSIRTR